MKKLFINDQQVKDYTHAIIRQMYLNDYKPDLVIGFVRGGCTPANYISQYYDIPCYMHNKEQEIDYFDKDLRNYFHKDFHHILVVDDINDTGNALTEFNNALFEVQGEDFEVKYGALLTNVGSRFEIDYYGRRINKIDNPCWVVFPWENWWEVIPSSDD